jgi:hypothetical protein
VNDQTGRVYKSSIQRPGVTKKGAGKYCDQHMEVNRAAFGFRFSSLPNR